MRELKHIFDPKVGVITTQYSNMAVVTLLHSKEGLHFNQHYIFLSSGNFESVQTLALLARVIASMVCLCAKFCIKAENDLHTLHILQQKKIYKRKIIIMLCLLIITV